VAAAAAATLGERKPCMATAPARRKPTSARGRPVGAVRRCSRLTHRSCAPPLKVDPQEPPPLPGPTQRPPPLQIWSRSTQRPAACLPSFSRLTAGGKELQLSTTQWQDPRPCAHSPLEAVCETGCACVSLGVDRSFICASGRGLCWRWS
jgi:hypothetical protein